MFKLPIAILIDEFSAKCFESKEKQPGREDVSSCVQNFPKVNTVLNKFPLIKTNKVLDIENYWTSIQYEFVDSSSMVSKSDKRGKCEVCSRKNIELGIFYIPCKTRKDSARKTAYTFWLEENRENVVQLLINDENSRTFRRTGNSTYTVDPSQFRDGKPNFCQVANKCSSMWQFDLTEEEKAKYIMKSNKDAEPEKAEGKIWTILKFHLCLVCCYAMPELKFFYKEGSNQNVEIECLPPLGFYERTKNKLIKNKLIKNKGWYIYMLLRHSLVGEILPAELLVLISYLRIYLLL
jgi:hypothetical protein